MNASACDISIFTPSTALGAVRYTWRQSESHTHDRHTLNSVRSLNWNYIWHLSTCKTFTSLRRQWQRQRRRWRWRWNKEKLVRHLRCVCCTSARESMTRLPSCWGVCQCVCRANAILDRTPNWRLSLTLVYYGEIRGKSSRQQKKKRSGAKYEIRLRLTSTATPFIWRTLRCDGRLNATKCCFCNVFVDCVRCMCVCATYLRVPSRTRRKCET